LFIDVKQSAMWAALLYLAVMMEIFICKEKCSQLLWKYPVTVVYVNKINKNGESQLEPVVRYLSAHDFEIRQRLRKNLILRF